MALSLAERHDIQGFVNRAGIRSLNPMQRQAIRAIADSKDILLVAPTGSGKTEAALFPVLTKLRASHDAGIGLVYVTPLRALNRNLTERITRLVAQTELTAAVRHGDTPASERRKQAAHPPDILITTPETLQAVLPGRVMQRHLRNVRFVIIDEVHQLAEDRRGIRPDGLAANSRSATVASHETVASRSSCHPEIVSRFAPRDFSP